MPLDNDDLQAWLEATSGGIPVEGEVEPDPDPPPMRAEEPPELEEPDREPPRSPSEPEVPELRVEEPEIPPAGDASWSVPDLPEPASQSVNEPELMGLREMVSREYSPSGETDEESIMKVVFEKVREFEVREIKRINEAGNLEPAPDLTKDFEDPPFDIREGVRR